jgi:hypothetical protein
MVDKHTAYYELRDALAAGGCALCRLAYSASTHYLDTLNYEGVNDPGLRQDLVRAHGLCRRHTWQWTRIHGSVLGVAIVYRNVIKHLLEGLGPAEGASSHARSGIRLLAERLQPEADCPACLVEAEAAQRASDLLLDHLSEQEIADRYVPAGGVCLPHLQRVIAAASESQARTLLAWQTEVYHKLVGQLDEFIRKQDYRFAGEPLGDERDSTTRSAAVVAGEREA